MLSYDSKPFLQIFKFLFNITDKLMSSAKYNLTIY